MTRYVAFLRAINLAGKRAVSMERLRKKFEALGYDDVSTYIVSGNVLFSVTSGRPPALEKAIERQLAPAFGFEIPTMVRTVKKVKAALELEPFGSVRSGDTWSITFLRKAPPPAVRQAVQALSGKNDQLQVHGSELHWLIHGKRGDSALKPNAIERALGSIEGTNRNTTMLKKLLARA